MPQASCSSSSSSSSSRATGSDTLDFLEIQESGGAKASITVEAEKNLDEVILERNQMSPSTSSRELTDLEVLGLSSSSSSMRE